MACMSHECLDCGEWWFDNEPRSDCPKCGSSNTIGFFDEKGGGADYSTVVILFGLLILAIGIMIFDYGRGADVERSRADSLQSVLDTAKVKVDTIYGDLTAEGFHLKCYILPEGD